MGISPFEHLFDRAADRYAGDFGFEGRLNRWSELIGVSDNLCLSRGGLRALISGSFTVPLDSGTIMKSKSGANRTRRARRGQPTEVSFGGSGVRIVRTEMSCRPVL